MSTNAVETVAVLGAGTMGHGIAQVCAAAGASVRLFDVTQEAAAAGLRRVEGNLTKGIARGKVTEAQRDAVLERLSATSSLADAVAGVDLVIEAVPERLELKRDLFAKVAEVVSPETLLASNTSSIPIAKLAQGMPNPDRFLGMHFFNPVFIQPLVEIVRAEATSDEAIDRAVALSQAMGKDPIVVRDSPGFASSRLGLALGLEAIRMLEEGVASAEDIDKAMQLGYRHPMGPLKLTDLVGLDVRLAIAETLSREIDDVRFRPPQLLRDLVAQGALGKKAGRGFYTYDS